MQAGELVKTSNFIFLFICCSSSTFNTRTTPVASIKNCVGELHILPSENDNQLKYPLAHHYTVIYKV